MGQMRILVIEDEKKTAAFLAKGLREAGFAVDLARDGETGLEQARATKFDLLIVDIMLPHKDGWEVVTELRRDGVRTPILFLTARDSVRDRVKGLELGADDYPDVARIMGPWSHHFKGFTADVNIYKSPRGGTSLQKHLPSHYDGVFY